MYSQRVRRRTMVSQFGSVVLDCKIEIVRCEVEVNDDVRICRDWTSRARMGGASNVV